MIDLGSQMKQSQSPSQIEPRPVEILQSAGVFYPLARHIDRPKH